MKIEKLLFGDDETQGIVSIYADRQGNVHIWQRNQETGELSYHRKEIYHWAIVTDPDLREGILKVRELEGDHPLRYLVGSRSDRQLQKQIVFNYNRKHHAGIRSLFDLKKTNAVYSLSAIEQFLVKSGITHFKGLEWVKVHRLCFDLETSSLNPAEGEILAIAVRDNRGYEQVIHSDKEAEIISEFVSRVQELDPDVIEGFNIFGFDFPFLDFRAKQHKIPLAIGRIYQTKNGETTRSTLAESGTRSLKVGGNTEQYQNYTLIGREIIDTYHAVKRWNAITRELPNHRLKDVAIHFGIAEADREYIAGDQIAEVWKHDKDRVIRYALGDVRETMQIADLLMGSAFELAKIVPTSFERIATSGTATAIDLLMVRGYLNQNHALPLPKQKKDRYEGGHTEICLSGVIENVVKADVESMYPNIMLTHLIAPESDHLGLFLPMLGSLTETRLDLKGKLKTLDRDSRDYHAVDARQGALKILINSAYGYLGTGFTTFNDPDQAAKVTRIGREIILQMKSIVESFGGTPIEIDTDGIFIGLDEDSDPEYFVGQINERLARPEVKIGFDGHWQAGYFVGMKNYALIDQPGKLTIKGASLKSSNLETAFRDYISEGLVDLLSGDLKALKKRFRNLFTGLEDRTIPTEDIAATKRLAKNPDEYKGKQPQVEAAKNAGLELKQGDFVTHYRAITGEWKVLDTDRDYDSQFYIKKLIETNRRVFGSAFTEADFKALFGESEGISIDAIKPIQSERNTADLAWVELMYGTTLVGQRKRKRVIRKWFRLDDQESIDEFIRKHKNTDLHRSQLVVYSPAQPKKGDHRKCKRLGKFLIEIDGDKNDPMKAVQCTIEMLRIIDEKLGVTPEIRFSGNKSFYLSIQLDAGPGYNLHEKHKRFAEALRDLLPEQYQSMIDMEVYDSDQTLRLEGSYYPNGIGYNVEIPISLIEAGDFQGIKGLSQKLELKLSDSLQFQADRVYGINEKGGETTPTNRGRVREEKHVEFYHRVTGDVSDDLQDPPKSSNRRKQRAKQTAQKVIDLGYEDTIIAPCVESLRQAIHNGDTIGFDGRNKFISEAANIGKDEDWIVETFLQDPDPFKYGVIERDGRENPNPSGFKLIDSFSIDRLDEFDISCEKCSQWCDVANCYRAKDFLPKVNSPPFEDFRNRSRGALRDVIDDPITYETRGITAIDGSIASGKTYQETRKGLELVSDYNVAIFLPTHKAISDIFSDKIPTIGKIESIGIPENAIVVHVFGKREETCIPEYFEKETACAQCPIFKKFFRVAKSDDPKEVDRAKKAGEKRNRIRAENLGKAVDLESLQRIAKRHGACASVVSKILAQPENESHNVLAILPHAYLIKESYQAVIRKIDPQFIFIDEADMIPDQLIAENQRFLTIAETRSRLDQPYSTIGKACNFRCEDCKLHFSDSYGRKIRIQRRLENEAEYEKVGNPDHFVEYIKASIGEAKRLVKQFAIPNVFDFETIERNLGRIESALKVVEKGDLTPYQYIDALQRETENQRIEGITVDKISEGLTIKIDNATRQIRPPISITSLAVDRCLSDESLLCPDEIPDESNGEKKLRITDLIPDKQERKKVLETSDFDSIGALLEFVNFCDNAPNGKIGMYYELRNEYADSVDDETDETAKPADFGYKRGAIKFCAIRLRYLDIEPYQQVVNFLADRHSLLLSGSFLSHALVAQSFLLKPEEITYIDARVDMPENALIIHHNPQFGKLAPNPIDLKTFGNTHMVDLIQRIEAKRSTKVLIFERNERQGRVLFSHMARDESNTVFRIEDHSIANSTRIAEWDRIENQKSQSKRDPVVIDKLRSATSRAVDRRFYDLGIVHGNGYPNFYDLIPFTHAIRQAVDPDCELDTMIHYNRRRAVIQALLRNPRDENLKVCLYLNGDMSHLDYPKDLLGRVVTTNDLLLRLSEMYPDDFLNNRETQIELLSRVIVGFLDGNVTRDDISAVIADFDFAGTYTGGKRESRKQSVDTSGLDGIHQYLVDAWIETRKDSTDNAKVIKAVITRLNLVDKKIAEKGYTEIRDRRGDKEWKPFLEFLVAKNYLKHTTIPTKTKSKTVYAKKD